MREAQATPTANGLRARYLRCRQLLAKCQGILPRLSILIVLMQSASGGNPQDRAASLISNY